MRTWLFLLPNVLNTQSPPIIATKHTVATSITIPTTTAMTPAEVGVLLEMQIRGRDDFEPILGPGTTAAKRSLTRWRVPRR